MSAGGSLQPELDRIAVIELTKRLAALEVQVEQIMGLMHKLIERLDSIRV